MTGSSVVNGRWARLLLAVGVFCGSLADAQDGEGRGSTDDTDSRGAARLIDVNVTLYRSSLTAQQGLIYDEIFGHFADAVFEATEGQQIIGDVNVFLDGQPWFDPPPVINVNGFNPFFMDANQAYTDAGATALDFPDGPVPVTATGSVNIGLEGIYAINYSAVDSSGQMSFARRLVHVRGRNPVIVLAGDNPVWHTEDTPYDDAGAFSLDITDGNLSDNIQIQNPVVVGETGTYEVVYTVTDSGGHTTTATRVVNVIPENFDEPIIEIIGLNPLTLDVGQPYIEQGATATDATDGFLGFADISGSVNTNVSGTYRLLYSKSDFQGNTRVAVRTVVVTGREPAIILQGPNPITVEAGPAYIDPGALAVDITDGNITDSLLQDISVDTTGPGDGFVDYFVADSEGGFAFATRVVHVVEAANRGQTANVYWSERGVPGFRSSGGFGTDGGQILMSDVFPGGEAGGDIEFLTTTEDRRRAGYIMASLWLQYALGLGPESRVVGGDIPVANSILADPYSPAFASNGLGLNMSATRDGIATGGVFQTLESTRATQQHRLQGASAWATVARTYGQDPKPARLIAKRPRTPFNELLNNAPVGDATPVTNLNSIPTGTTGTANYVDNARSWFRIASENTIPIVSGERIRTANTCRPGRLIDVRTPNPIVFEFPADSSILELRVSIRVPCSNDVSNLDATLTDPTGRLVEPALFLISGALEFVKTPSVTGKWRLVLTPRNQTTRGVQIDVLGRSFDETPRISAELVSFPAPTQWLNGPRTSGFPTTVFYPEPFVLNVSNAMGRAIRGVEMVGRVTLPSGGERLFDLKDDGASPDVTAGDGVYSALILYNQDGPHQVEISMVDTLGTSLYTLNGVSLAPRVGFSDIEPTPRPADELVGDPFIRNSILTFDVVNVQSDDHGDSFLEATPISLDNEDFLARFDRGGDTDYFSVDVVARGATLDTVFRATQYSGAGLPELRLFDSSGITEIARNSISPTGYPMIRQALPSGRYYLAVTAPPAEPGDSYSVSAGATVPSDTAFIGIGAAVAPPSRGGGGGGGGCFIATAAYGTPLDAQIGVLRDARDGYLLTNIAGSMFSDAYYRISPPIAAWVAENAAARSVVRGALHVVLHPAWAVMMLSAMAFVVMTGRARRRDRVRVKR